MCNDIDLSGNPAAIMRQIIEAGGDSLTSEQNEQFERWEKYLNEPANIAGQKHSMICDRCGNEVLLTLKNGKGAPPVVICDCKTVMRCILVRIKKGL